MNPANFSSIEAKLIAATRDDVRGIDAVDPGLLGPECMVGYDRFAWQNYVPVEVRESWRDLPLVARLTAFLVAHRQEICAVDPD
jgi:hypothetical protein